MNIDRRQILATAVAGTALALGPEKVAAGGHGQVGFVLVHGSWHGSWCWQPVQQGLGELGHLSIAVDLPGCGLNAVSPKSFYERPLDPAKFATEVSQFAEIPSEAFADAVLEAAGALRAQGADKVVAVGHSMGGMPITLAAAKDPEAIQGLVFASAVTAVPGKPGGAYLGPPAPGPDGQPRNVVMADPAAVAALRIDPRSSDPDYYATGKAALAADVPDDLWRAALNMMTPDAPAAFYGEVIEFPEAYAGIERTFIRLGADEVLLPAYQDAMIADMNATWADNPTRVIEMQTSHEVMFADVPGLVSAISSAA